VINSICRLKENVELPECKCVNRQLDDIYKSVSGEKWGNDSCWYKPCKNTANYHVPSSLKNQECNANICQQIIDVVGQKGNTDIDITRIQNSIDCKFDRKPQNENDKNKDDEDKDDEDEDDNNPPLPPLRPTPPKEEKEEEKEEKEKEEEKEDQTILEKIKNNTALLISLIVVGVIILIVWIYFMYRMFKK
jgi:hypothetical protein